MNSPQPIFGSEFLTALSILLVQQLFASVLLSQWSDQGKAMIQLVVLV
jgi:hypothetical protein